MAVKLNVFAVLSIFSRMDCPFPILGGGGGLDGNNNNSNNSLFPPIRRVQRIIIRSDLLALVCGV